MLLSPGQEFAGHRIDAVAGRGGMGVVYRATDLRLDRVVALKIIAPKYVDDEAFLRRFERESRVAASIRHPNVITIFQAGESAGALYLTMEYVKGSDLRTLIRSTGKLEPRVAADVIAQTAAALDAAHSSGLIHRDVKPGNVLIGYEPDQPHAYVTDFGLAKQTVSDSDLTSPGVVVGTFDYIPPEQIRGDDVDARADVYSLGCVLYQALTGRVPYPRDTDAAKLWAHMAEPPPEVTSVRPDAPEQFDAIIERALAKDREARYPSAGDLGRAALAAAEGQAARVTERSVATGNAAPRSGEELPTLAMTGSSELATASLTGAPAPARTRRWRLAAAAAALAVVAGVVVLTQTGSDHGGGKTAVTTRQEKPRPSGPYVAKTVPLSEASNSLVAGPDEAWVAGAGSAIRRIGPHAGYKPEVLRVPNSIAATTRPLTVGAGAVWIDTSPNAVTRIDLRTGRRRSIAVPDSRFHRVAIAGKTVWVLSPGPTQSTLRKLTAKGDKTSDFPIFKPHAFQLAADRHHVYVLWQDPLARPDQSLLTYDTAGHPVPSSPTGTHAVSVRSVDGVLYMTDKHNRLIAVDTHPPQSIVHTSLGRGFRTLDVENGIAWVSYDNGILRRFNPITRKAVGTRLRLPGSGQVVDAEGSHVWVLIQGAGTKLVDVRP